MRPFSILGLLAATLLPLACAKRVDYSKERVYITDEKSGVVVVVDASKDEVVARVPVGKRPRGIRVSPDGARVLVAMSGSPSSPPGTDPAALPPPDRTADGIGVINVAALKLERVITAGQDPEMFDLTRDGKRLWASNEETSEATLIDVDSSQVLGRASVGEEPEGVGIHPEGKHVYVANEKDNSVSVLDVRSGATIARVPVCERPRSIAFSPDGQRAFTACEESHSITVIQTSSLTATGNVELSGEGVRPMGLVISPDGRTLYASGGRGRTVHVIDLSVGTPRVKATISDVGQRVWGVALAHGGSKLYTANGPSGDVSVIDTAKGTVLRRIAVGGSPWGIAVH
jgi:YVTN family beta-propeller protein